MSTTFPSLLPKLTDPLWFDVDKAFEDEQALASEEREHQNWLLSIREKDQDMIPVGKTASETYEEDEEDDDEDEIETEEESEEADDLEGDEMNDYDQDSPDDVDMDMNNDAEVSDSPPWMM
ncbi:anaphase-promoting complex subunit 15B-like [Amphiura filiformis]|uniref:anaphase-promoting complex subunit 15B-like n=1 Tax=Amphiura filiformis TaxID=82378 RepID=UPI003B220CE6